MFFSRTKYNLFVIQKSTARQDTLAMQSTKIGINFTIAAIKNEIIIFFFKKK